MTGAPTTKQALQAEVANLRARLEEEQETLRVIRSGEVDALVVLGPQGEQAYTLKGAEEPYRLMVEAMTEGAVTFAPDGTILYCNARLAEFLKLPLQQVIGAALHGFVAPHERASLAAQLTHSRHAVGRWKTTLLAHDGAAVPVQFSTHSFKVDHQEAIVAVVTDLSDVVAAAEARSRLALIVGSSEDAIVSTTLDGVVESWNAAAERLFGYGAAEAIGRPITSLIIPPERTDQFAQKLESIGRGERSGHIETVRRRKDGARIDVAVTESPIKDHSGRVVGASIIQRDISERKRLEEQLQRHRDHLEDLVDQRTAELRRANARLQELDQLKSMFIASMSHELRTPLNSIIGFTGVLLQGIAGELNVEQLKQLAIVKASANHLLALINDVLDISQVEAGKVELSLREVDLTALAREVAESFAAAAQAKGLTLTVSAADNPVVESDRRRIRQILVNLMGNAVKFTDRGGIEISVSRRADGAQIDVRDTGIGIHREVVPELFTAFRQIVTEGRPKEGTGLGLYLSRRIAQLLGGEIAAQSELGKGSVFTLVLPLRPRSTD